MVSRPRQLGGLAARYLSLLVLAAVMLLPFAELYVGALRTAAERFARPPVFWPAEPQWGVFRRVFAELPFLAWTLNSLIVTLSITALQLLTSAAAGFALAKYRFRGRDLLLRLVVAAQIFPFFLFLIPMFFILRYWPLAGGNDLLGQGGTGLLNTYAALILPFAVSWYGVFMLRQYLLGIPDELLDAARIDGASELRIFFGIVLPLARPALLTLGLFVFIYHWNEFLWTTTVTRTAPELQTLPVGIYLLRSAFETPSGEALRQAALALSALPLIFLFVPLQRFYTQGYFASGVRG